MVIKEEVRVKKITTLILCLGIFAGLLCACSAPAAGKGAAKGTASEKDNNKSGAEMKMVLHEPEYLKPSDINHKPVFTLSWDPYPNAYSYEFAIYVEGEDSYGRGPFAIRSTKGIYSKEAVSADLYFLQGIYTDTATYRIKIRPSLKAAEKKEDYIWSNIWQISFVDGKYTISATDADFDEEIEAANAQKEKKKEGGGNTGKPEKKEPLAHSFPEELLLYLAREEGETEAFSAEDIASLSVGVNYCEYAEPVQNITDGETIEAFKKAVQQMTVTGKYDEVFSTETYYAYSAKDAEGNALFSFSIQKGLLDRNDGRYSVEGLSELLSIPGIMLEEGWNAYWDEYNSKADAYERDIDPVGMNLLEAAGYGTHMMNSGAPDNIYYIDAYIDYAKDVPKMQTRDKAEIEAVYKGLSKIKVGKEADNIGGRMWHMTFGYSDPAYNFSRDTYLSFKGDYIKLGGDYYELENIEELYGSLDCEIFRYMKDFSDAPALKPVY